MVAIRTIMAALLAISMALLPVAIPKAVAVPSMATATAMSDQADMPCCPDCDDHDNFKSAACMATCMSLVAAFLPARDIALPHLSDPSVLVAGCNMLHGLAVPPPTHPPQV